MRKYITNLYGQSEQSTAMTAQHMITKLAQDEGFKEISVSAYSVSEDTPEEKEKESLACCLLSHKEIWPLLKCHLGTGLHLMKFLKTLRERVDKLVVFIHDFVPLMFQNNDYLFERYLEAYNLADLVILPSERMEKNYENAV